MAHDNPVYHVGHEVRRSTNRFVCLLRGYGPARLKQSDETFTSTVGDVVHYKFQWTISRLSAHGLLTSAVTADWKPVTYRNQGERMATFGALRTLRSPYWTLDLCPASLCPHSEFGLIGA